MHLVVSVMFLSPEIAGLEKSFSHRPSIMQVTEETTHLSPSTVLLSQVRRPY